MTSTNEKCRVFTAQQHVKHVQRKDPWVSMINEEENNPTGHHLFIQHTCLSVYMPVVQTTILKYKRKPLITDSNVLKHMDTFILQSP